MIAQLNTARIALQQANWSVVNQILLQLPLEKYDTTESRLSEEEWRAVLDLAVQILCESDFGQRWEIAKLFPKLGDRAIAPLIALLEDETLDSEIRWFVGRILSQFHHPDCVIALAKLLQQSEEEELAAVAAQALGSIGSSAIAPLTDLLESPATRLPATQALSQMRHSQTIAPLLTVVQDANPDVRATAIEALGSFHHPEIYPILLVALTDPFAAVRKEAIVALSYSTETSVFPEVVRHLAPLLYDLKPEIAQQAAIALGRIGTPDAIATLVPVLQSAVTPIGLKQEIVRALGWMETSDALRSLQAVLRSGDESLTQEVIAVLSHCEQPQCRQQAAHILSEFFHSGQTALNNPLIRQSLATAVGELGESEGSEILINLAQDSDRRVKLHALAALKKLSKQQNLSV
jgi:HEAT repeat protein